MASVLRFNFMANRETSWLIRRKLSALLTPVEEFPGLPSTIPTPASTGSVLVTTLSNGLTVVSENSSSSSSISLTFPKAGSVFESNMEVGAAIVSKCLAFKSGSGLSSALITRNLDNNGASSFATSGRKKSTIGFTTHPEKAVNIVPLLATNCTFENWDLVDARKQASVEVNEAMLSAETLLTESIFAAAFGAQSAMGKPYYSTGASIDSIKSFRNRSYVLNSAVLAATGICDHDTFVRAVEEGLSEAAVGPSGDIPKSTFIGSECRVHDPFSKYAYIALAFPHLGSIPLLNVLKQYISLSIQGVSGFATTDLVGGFGVTDPDNSCAIVDALCSVVTSTPSVPVVERAKFLAKAETIFALDRGSRCLAEVMAWSVLEYGNFSTVDTFTEYDSITLDDISSAFKYMAKNIPALAAVGNIDRVPYQGSLSSRFS